MVNPRHPECQDGFQPSGLDAKGGNILVEGTFEDLKQSPNEFVAQFLRDASQAGNMTRAFRLGVFIVAMLLILAAGILMIGNKQLLFSRTFGLRADFQNVGGLEGGAEVRVGGIHEGTVRTIKLPSRPDEKVTVVMDLDPSTRNVIKRDSIAWIKTEGLLGDKYVEISFGSKEAENVKDGDTAEGQLPMDLSDMIKKTDQIIDTTKDAMQNVDQTAANLKSVTSKISEGKGSLGALINDKKVYKEADAAAAQAQAGTTGMKGDTASEREKPSRQPMAQFEFSFTRLVRPRRQVKIKITNANASGHLTPRCIAPSFD